MSEINSIPGVLGFSPPQVPMEEQKGAQTQVFRVFENAARPVVLPFFVSRRAEVEVKTTEERVHRVEAVVETGLDPDEEFSEDADSEKEEGDDSKEEAPEVIDQKPSKALEKVKSILTHNF